MLLQVPPIPMPVPKGKRGCRIQRSPHASEERRRRHVICHMHSFCPMSYDPTHLVESRTIHEIHFNDHNINSTNFESSETLQCCTFPLQRRSRSMNLACKNINSAKCFKSVTCMHVSRQARCTSPYIGVRIGQAKNPGPANNQSQTRQDTKLERTEKQIEETQGYKLHIANVTNLLTNGYLLAKQTCNAMIVSEHSIRQFQVNEAIEILGGSCKMCLSDLDPEVSTTLEE